MTSGWRWMIATMIAGGALLEGCAARHSTAVAPAQGSILAAASPAPDLTVDGPVDELQLRFASPVRLDEVIVSGPDGTMPSMIHAAGETRDYAIPLSASSPGRYVVSWRATAGSTPHRGSFSFSIR